MVAGFMRPFIGWLLELGPLFEEVLRRRTYESNSGNSGTCNMWRNSQCQTK